MQMHAGDVEKFEDKNEELKLKFESEIKIG